MDGPAQIAGDTDTCRLCGQLARHVCTQKILHRYDVAYFRCPGCDLIQTEPPYWLDEAYTSAISALDTGAIERTRLCTQLALCLAWLCRIGPDSACIDYGGGHGILTRAMRDYGYNFFWHDKYAENLFARGFEADPTRPHTMLTCFEVWEHLPNVATDLELLFHPGHDFLLIGTFLHRGHRDNWWYYSPQTGQHVAFFSDRTMRFIANRFGYDLIESQRYTLFHKPGLLRGWRRACAAQILRRSQPARNSHWATLALAVRRRYPRRTWDDHELMLKVPSAKSVAFAAWDHI